MENRFQDMYDKAMYSPIKCNSASKLSGCIMRDQSKIILVLPTNNSVMEIFEKKTLTGGFNCVNTRLSFDTEILMPNLAESDYKKNKTGESFKAYKHDDLKVIYTIKLGNENSYHERRIISAILKLDENSQYGFTMAKPILAGYIKEQPAPSWLKFNLLLKTVDLDDDIGDLFVLDIKFDKKRFTQQDYMCNEILTPIIEKQKILEANERSVYQLLELIYKTNHNKPNSYHCIKKSHATMFPKKFIPLYLEDLTFLITRCCWRVTKIHSHYTFKKVRFKREFVAMNQNCRQNAKTAIEKDFFKLMNNANFRYDCRNNAHNAKFKPIIDEVNEITYIKKYYNLFDSKISNFVNSDVL